MMDQNRGFDLGNISGGGHCTVKRRGGGQIGPEPDGQRIGDATAVAETGDADLAAAVGARFQPERGRHEVFRLLTRIDLRE